MRLSTSGNVRRRDFSTKEILSSNISWSLVAEPQKCHFYCSNVSYAVCANKGWCSTLDSIIVTYGDDSMILQIPGEVPPHSSARVP